MNAKVEKAATVISHVFTGIMIGFFATVYTGLPELKHESHDPHCTTSITALIGPCSEEQKLSMLEERHAKDVFERYEALNGNDN